MAVKATAHRKAMKQMELTDAEIGVLLESLKYSIQRVSDAQGAPDAVRKENLQRLRGVQEKLREMRDVRPG
jgi:hypothetical protein